MCISARDDSLSWAMHAVLYVCSRLKEIALLLHWLFIKRVSVSYRGIATKSQRNNNGMKTGGHCENKCDLPSISRCKTVVN